MDLINACAANDLQMVESLLKEGRAWVDYKDKNNDTSLIIAVRKNLLQCAGLLLQNGKNHNSSGANVNMKNNKNETPLSIATTLNQYEMVDLLLANNANIDIVDNNNNTPLLIAVANGNYNIVKRLLSSKATINIKNNKNDTAIILASSSGFADILELLLLCPNNFENDKEHGLICATKNNKMNCIEILLKNNVNVNCNDAQPLREAILLGEIAIVEYLLKNGANPNINLLDSHENALVCAIQMDKFELFVLLYTYTTNKDLICELIFAIYWCRPNIVEFILSFGYMNINKKVLLKTSQSNKFSIENCYNNRTSWNCHQSIDVCPLIFAIHLAYRDSNKINIENKIKIIELLLSKKSTSIDVCYSDPHYQKKKDNDSECMRHPLCIVNANNSVYCPGDKDKPQVVQLTKLLMKKYQENNYSELPSCTSQNNIIGLIILLDSASTLESLIINNKIILNNEVLNNLFRHSIAYHNYDMMSILLHHSKNPNYCMNGRSLLHTACHVGDAKLVELLLLKGAKIHIKYQESTEINVAVKNGSCQIVEMLLKNGSDVNDVDSKKQTPLAYALANNRDDMVQILLKYGADINYIDYYSKTPLMYAAKTGNVAIINMLLGNKADANYKNNKNENAITVAVSNGHTEIVKILSKNSTTDNKLDGTLHDAYPRNKNMIFLLIELGANINYRDPRYNNNTVLEMIYCGSDANFDEDVVKFLLQNGGRAELDVGAMSPMIKKKVDGLLLNIQIKDYIESNQIDKAMQLCGINVTYVPITCTIKCIHCENNMECRLKCCNCTYCLNCFIVCHIQRDSKCIVCKKSCNKIIFYNDKLAKRYEYKHKQTNFLQNAMGSLRQIFSSQKA